MHCSSKWQLYNVIVMYLVTGWRGWRGSEDNRNKKLAYNCHIPEGMEDCIRSQGSQWTVVIEELEEEEEEEEKK